MAAAAASKKPTDTAPNFEGLIDLITQTVAPKSWDQNGGAGTIAAFDRSLVVSQTQDVPRANRGPAGSAPGHAASDAGRCCRSTVALAGQGRPRPVARREALARRSRCADRRRRGPRSGCPQGPRLSRPDGMDERPIDAPRFRGPAIGCRRGDSLGRGSVGQPPGANAGTAPAAGLGMGGMFIIPVDQPATPAAGGKLPTPPAGSQPAQQPRLS